MEATIKKEVGIAIFIVVFSALLFWLLVSVNILVSNPYVFVLLVLAILVWIACLAIALALVGKISAIVLNIVIPVLLAVIGMSHIEVVIAAALILGLLSSARFMFLRELKSRIKIKTRYVFYAGTKALVMVVIVMITGVSMPYITKSIMTDDMVIPVETVRWFLKPYEPFIEKSIPGASLDSSIDELAQQQLEEQYPGNSREAILQKEMLSKQLQKQLSAQLNQEVSVSEDMASIVATAINKQIYVTTSNYPIMTPIGIFVLVLLVSRIIIPVIAGVVLLEIAFLIWLGRQGRLIRLLTVSKPVEELEL